MAEVTAAMVKELRERTGSGMMDCKRALSEVGCDMEKAIVLPSGKRPGRCFKEGGPGSR